MGTTQNKAASLKPRKGDPVTYRGRSLGNVTSVDGNLCWTDRDSFIWRFHDGLNALHDWPTKGERP